MVNRTPGPPAAARYARLAEAASAALSPTRRPGSAALALRLALCLGALLTISSLVGETGKTAYLALNYPVLIYAGLSLPWPAVLGLTVCAAAGPNVHGSVFLALVKDDAVDVVRPVALALVSATALALARSYGAKETTLRGSERRLFSFLEGMPLGVFALDAEGEIYFANQSARRLLGPPSTPTLHAGNLSEAYNTRIAGSGEPYPLSRIPVVRALAGETSVVDDVEVWRGDERMSLQVWGAPIRDDSGRVTHAVSAFSNITAQKRFEAALQESEARFRTVFEEGPLGIAIAGLDYRYAQVNQALCDMTGYRGDELSGLTLFDLTHPDDHRLHSEQIARMENGDVSVVDIEKRLLRKDGEAIWVRVCIRRVHDNSGRPAYNLLMVQDITEQRRALAQVERMATHDELTGLPNRRLLYDRLAQAVARARRYAGAVVVLSIDLDGFKLINDRHGHTAGDAVLIETARRLREALRDTDTVARMGDDEFVALITDAAGVDVDTVCRRIEASLSRPVSFAGEELHLGASIGRATLFEDGDSEDALITAADDAMLRDKESRRLRASR